QDPRLARQVTITETGISLKALLHQLSDQHLEFTVLPICQEQKLQIRMKQRPLRALLSSIAELLGGEWTPMQDKTGYRFCQSDATILRRRRWWSLFQAEREEALADLRTAMLQAMHTTQKPIYYDVADKQNEAEQNARLQTMDASSHNLFTQLPQALQEQFTQQI